MPDLAAGKTATASSVEDGSPTLQPPNAVDGDPTTRWGSSFADGEWWQVDLGATVLNVQRVDIDWEAAWATRYRISGSLDGTTFTPIIDVWGIGRGSDVGSDAVRQTTVFGATPARYIRVIGLQRATAYGISIWNVSVYAAVAADSILLREHGDGATFDAIRVGHGVGTMQAQGGNFLTDATTWWKWSWRGYPPSAASVWFQGTLDSARSWVTGWLQSLPNN